LRLPNTELGNAYGVGRGVSQSYTSAAAWYFKRSQHTAVSRYRYFSCLGTVFLHRASATVGGLELFGRPSPIIRLRPGSKECEVSKFCAALLPQLMFVCLLARLRAEPKHPLPMHNQTKLTVAVIAVSHNRSSGFLNEETPVPCSSPRVLS
jgi:hypothetical protein